MNDSNIITSESTHSDVASITLDGIYSNLKIEPHDGSTIKVIVTGPSKRVNAITVNRHGDELRISEDTSGELGIRINGAGASGDININRGNAIHIGSVVGSISVSHMAGRSQIIINGKDVTKSAQSEPEPPTTIVVRVPRNVSRDYDLDLNGSCEASIADIGGIASMDVDMSGCSRLTAWTVAGKTKVDISGTASFGATYASGDVSIDASGCSTVNLYGTSINKLDIDASGTARVVARGICDRAYLDASGCANIHVDHAHRVVRKDVSGVASVRVERVGP